MGPDEKQDLTMWRRLVLPAHKAARPEQWQRLTTRLFPLHINLTVCSLCTGVPVRTRRKGLCGLGGGCGECARVHRYYMSKPFA